MNHPKLTLTAVFCCKTHIIWLNSAQPGHDSDIGVDEFIEEETLLDW